MVDAAHRQRHETPAAEVPRTGKRLDELDASREELTEADPRERWSGACRAWGSSSAEFLAEVGDLSRFGSADRLAAAAGLAPVLGPRARSRTKEGLGRAAP